VNRHSEERSDEESLLLLETIREGFLALLGMTETGTFSASCRILDQISNIVMAKWFVYR